MNIEEIRTKVRLRISKKKQIDGASEIVFDINKKIAQYPELNMVERDYAFRSALEHRTLYQWAAHYQVSYYTVYYMSHNPRVKQLREDILVNVRKYTVGMQMLLVREAMLQYLKIFRARDSADTLEAKRKAAKEILNSVGLINDTNEEGGTKVFNLNLIDNNTGNEPVETEYSRNVTMDDIKNEMKELEMLEDLRNKVDSHTKNNPNTKKKGSGGFEGKSEIPEITIE